MNRYQTFQRQGAGSGAIVVALALCVAGGVLMYERWNAKRLRRPVDDAPGRTARHTPRFGDYAVAGRSVSINRPREELYAFWRDFGNLATFMENIEAVQPSGDNRFAWTIKAPAGQTVHLETTIVQERENELLAWRSVEGSGIETEGRIRFRDAPTGHGTVVEAVIAYKPPAGELGRLVAKLFGREPQIQSRRDLKRFKALMETGEIPTAENRKRPA